MLIFEWDEAKRAANAARHGVDFASAEAIRWDTARYTQDNRREYREGRIRGFVMIGVRLHVMIFTIRKSGLRIISLRKANNREIGRYAKAL